MSTTTLYNQKITISTELRPCVVSHKQPALFHLWTTERGRLEGLVEYVTGKMTHVEASKIKFLDSELKIADYEVLFAQYNEEHGN